MKDLTIDIDLYAVDIMGDQATLTTMGRAEEYAVDLYTMQCSCRGFAVRKRCKHLQCVHAIKRLAAQPQPEPIF
jgi:hypothetical protein